MEVVSFDRGRFAPLIDERRLFGNVVTARLAENAFQSNAGNLRDRKQVAQNVSRSNAWQLILVADEHEVRAFGESLHKARAEPGIDHRKFVDDHDARFDGEVLVAGKAARFRIDFEQTVQSLGVVAGDFLHAACGAARGGGEGDVHFFGFGEGEDSL